MKKALAISFCIVLLCQLPACSCGAPSGASVKNDAYIVYKASDKSVEYFPDKMKQSMEILQDRLRMRGIDSAVVKKAGDDTLRVELPAGKQNAALFRTIGRYARFELLAPGGTVLVSNDDIAGAAIGKQNNEPVVNVRLYKEKTKAFADATEKLVGLQADMKVDGVILSSPTVNTPITGGEFYIQGGFSEEKANALAASLQIGPLPLQFEFVESGNATSQNKP